MSQTEEKGLDALDDEDWRNIEEMADEYDDQAGDDLESILSYRDQENEDDG